MRTPILMMITFAAAFAGNALAGYARAQEATTTIVEAASALTHEAINSARLDQIIAQPAPKATAPETPPRPDPAIVRLQILLDRAGASPGVIDGFDGENVRKAIVAFEAMHNLPVDGIPDTEMIRALDSGGPVVGHYEIVPGDVAAIVPPIPEDYAEKAQRDFLGYEGVPEELAERFHMDVDLLRALNPGIAYKAGDIVYVAAL
jgi:peptidoglycan hydrolase-like protein with peptidoglycan-binding domain